MPSHISQCGLLLDFPFLPSEFNFKYAVEEKTMTLKSTRLGLKHMICHKVAVWSWANYLTSLSHSFLICTKEIRHQVVLRIKRESLGGGSVI